MANPAEDIVKTIKAELERDTRIDLHKFPIRVERENDLIALEGMVENIAAKRIARHLAHRLAGNLPVADRLRIEVPENETEGRLRDEVVNLLQTEPVFDSSGLFVREGDRLETIRTDRSEWGDHRIEIEVIDGTVRLTGEVLSLSHRRMAEVLAWWAAGCQSVENLLHVVPPEQETDGELADAVRMVLEKDPLVHIDSLAITADHGTVTLEGSVASDEERQLAWLDAWYIPGVHEVVDRIQVRS